MAAVFHRGRATSRWRWRLARVIGLWLARRYGDTMEVTNSHGTATMRGWLT